jgi:hypothetical protein
MSQRYNMSLDTLLKSYYLVSPAFFFNDIIAQLEKERKAIGRLNLPKYFKK